MLKNKINALLGSFALLLLLIPYVEAAPPLGGVTPTPPLDITATQLNLSVTKEALSPGDDAPLADMPTALPAPLADMPTAVPASLLAATPDNSLLSLRLDLDLIIMSSDETSDGVAANRQDDEWRAAAAAQGMAYCVRGTLSDSDPNSAGINDTLFGDKVTGFSISYSLREINDGLMGRLITGEEDAQGIIVNNAFMKEVAPIPQELLDLGQESAAAFEEQVGSTSEANGLLFSFSEPGVKAFGAWFGGLGSRAPLEGTGLDGDPRGGKLAYMRLFDAEGRKIGPDRPIRPAQKEGESLCLDANRQPIDCAAANTRWIGFLASQPIAQMLLVVGDHDDSNEQLACRVEADGGSQAGFIAQCQAGDEHLSFVGPTICSEGILEEATSDPSEPIEPIEAIPTKSSKSAPTLLELIRDRPLQSLALTGVGVSLIGLLLLGFLWRKRG